MALSLKGDLQVDKVLMWKVQVPFENQVRQSSHFSLIGSEWCLQFSHKGKFSTGEYEDFMETKAIYKTFYHVITLHRVIDGQVAIASAVSGQLPSREHFSLKTFLMQPTYGRTEEKNVTHTRVQTNTTRIWFAGHKNNDIFKTFPSLYNCCEVTVVCKFYDRPLSTFQLNIGTEIEWSSDPQNRIPLKDKSVQASLTFPENMESLSSDFCHLLEKEILPDVRLECGNQTFQAHRCVLAARSDVFRAMFESKLAESETGVVKISDIDAAVLKKLLRFAYSGKQDDVTEDDAADLYEAADKYGVVSLRQACAYWITRNLRVENCVEYLKVADSHSDCELKDAVVSFIIRNPPLLKSAEWLALSKSSPVLANEVLQTYIASTVK